MNDAIDLNVLCIINSLEIAMLSSFIRGIKVCFIEKLETYPALPGLYGIY